MNHYVFEFQRTHPSSIGETPSEYAIIAAEDLNQAKTQFYKKYELPVSKHQVLLRGVESISSSMVARLATTGVSK
jgi:hypothetical protein|tara:strand:+ start:365 stop:589 length:225 start_codon:yes stop_codon:yes gene_type:complete